MAEVKASKDAIEVDPPPDRLDDEELRGYWLSQQRAGFTPAMARASTGPSGEAVNAAMFNAAVLVLNTAALSAKGDTIENITAHEPCLK